MDKIKFDNNRPNYMFCRECGQPLELLYTRGPVGIKSFPVWLGCKKCGSVYFFRKYSKVTKTGIYLTIVKDYSYEELKDQLSVGVTPKDPD